MGHEFIIEQLPKRGIPVHLRVSVGPAIPFSVGRLRLAVVFDCVAQALASTPLQLLLLVDFSKYSLLEFIVVQRSSLYYGSHNHRSLEYELRSNCFARDRTWLRDRRGRRRVEGCDS